MPGMSYSYEFSFDEAKVFEFTLNQTNTTRTQRTPPLPPLSAREFFDSWIAAHLESYTVLFQAAVMAAVTNRLQQIFQPNGDQAAQKAVLVALGLTDLI